jgi:signal peptidase I
LSIALGLTLLLVGVPLLVRTFYVGAFKVPDPGMAPNLLPGDHIFVRKDAYGRSDHRVPARGDIVVFRSPEHPGEDSVQRVIGLPGDTITLEQGAVFINGWRIPTCVVGIAEVDSGGTSPAGIAVVELLGDTAYLVFHDPPQHEHGEESEGHRHPGESEGPFTVPLNEVFVLGDNREHTQDSRHWFEGRGGGVRVDQIKGLASTIWMSFAQSKGINWSRVGSKLMDPPRCPAGFPPATCAALERCLGGRPPRETTTPPDKNVGAGTR